MIPAYPIQRIDHGCEILRNDHIYPESLLRASACEVLVRTPEETKYFHKRFQGHSPLICERESLWCYEVMHHEAHTNWYAVLIRFSPGTEFWYAKGPELDLHWQPHLRLDFGYHRQAYLPLRESDLARDDWHRQYRCTEWTIYRDLNTILRHRSTRA